MKRALAYFIVFISGFLFTFSAQADLLINPDAFAAEYTKDNSILIAQWEGDDAYDPFADYSEFEETSEEEADINFFNNGRLFTISFAASYRGFTSTLGTIYESSTGFGLYLNYFFDLRFAVQIGFALGDHGVVIDGGSDTNSASGSVSISAVSLDVKYFLNTQNVTRGLANLNPYIIGGLTQFSRTLKLDGETDFAKDSAIGLDIGAGIELPILRGKMYFGLQGIYHIVKFSDENQEIIFDGDAVNGASGVFPNGDIYTLQAILGINF